MKEEGCLAASMAGKGGFKEGYLEDSMAGKEGGLKRR